MKWSYHKNKHNDTRTVKRFALFPTQMTQTEANRVDMVWLEWYITHETFKVDWVGESYWEINKKEMLNEENEIYW